MLAALPHTPAFHRPTAIIGFADPARAVRTWSDGISARLGFACPEFPCRVCRFKRRLTSATASNLLRVTNGNGAVMHQFVSQPSSRSVISNLGAGAHGLALTSTAWSSGNLGTVTGSDGRTSVVGYLGTDPSMPIRTTNTDSNTGQSTINDYSYDSYGRLSAALAYFADGLVAIRHEYAYDKKTTR